jgi:hypothetical protein
VKDYRSNHDIDRIRQRLATAARPVEPTADDAPPAADSGSGERPVAFGRAPRPRRRVTSAVIIGAVAATIVIGPHFLRSSPTTNGATDPANGVATAQDVAPRGVDPTIDPCPTEQPRGPGQRRQVGALSGVALPGRDERI